MDNFTTLEPVRLHRNNRSLVSTAKRPSVGRLPTDLHVLVLSYLPVPDFVSYALASRSTAALARLEQVWQPRWNALAVDESSLSSILDALDTRKARVAAPQPTISVDDDFGDFAQVETVSGSLSGEIAQFVGAFEALSIPGIPVPSSTSFRGMYIRAHTLLKPLLAALSSPPHLILNSLQELTGLDTIAEQAKTLRVLFYFLSPAVNPVRDRQSTLLSLRLAVDRFDASLLTAFDVADGRNDESAMREAAESSWQVFDHTAGGDWEMGKVWAEKREIFYQQGSWNPYDNFTPQGGLAFDAMDEFMNHVLGAIHEHGSRAARVFPPASKVLILFAERIANEVVGEYITTLLTRAREISQAVFLQATAAVFREASRIVEAILQITSQRPDSLVTRTIAEDVVYRMFEPNMDEYLDEEIDAAKHAFEKVCKGWDQEASRQAAMASDKTRFLSSENPAQVKRNLISSFTSVLLLPVTIVPRTVGAVGAVLTTGGSAAVQGIAMLNPQRWGGASSSQPTASNYSRNMTSGSIMDDDNDPVFEIGDDEDAVDEKQPPPAPSFEPLPSESEETKFEMLVSLDIALELIHIDRDALKRAETFSGYPGHYGHRVRDTIEEIFILLLQALGDGHVAKGFAQATEQMRAHNPAEHDHTTSVAPLLQFFELVHIGDTIQSMVQVYFDKDLAPHIDKTDFLNAVVREKKRFENTLDDSVAAGLNAGTEALMNQVDHIITTLTKPREYYPPEDTPLELGPTKACTAAIECLDTHCKLLKGSTSREVLEVFYQEIGIRLIGILQKHIKRQIISLNGGFQIIADLNTYHAFIATLKVPSILADFANLKMLGHVYVVEDAKDLAQIVRDVTRYGGAYRPEDVYEFIQRRADWKKIEKTVDKAMYNLSFKEDCVVC